MKKTIVVLLTLCISVIGLSGCTSNQTNVDQKEFKQDSIELMEDLTDEMKLIVTKEKSTYSCDWYIDKYEQSNESIYSDVATICKNFKKCQEKRDTKLISKTLDSMMNVLDKVEKQ